MGSVGLPEVVVILFVALIVLGPDKLPGAARQVGKAMAEFRRISSGLQDEVRSALDMSDVRSGAAATNDGTRVHSEEPGEDVPPPRD